jgi:hypothetical protein
MQRIAALSRDSYAPALPSGVSHGAAHAALLSLLAEAAPEAMDLFAIPQEEKSGIAFLCPPGRLARADDLDPRGREALQRELGRLASALRRAASARAAEDPRRSGDLPVLVAAALEVPSFEQVFALSRDGGPGRPLLAGWGMTLAGAGARQGLITRYDDGRPATIRRRLQPALIGAAAAVIALLGVGAATALPWVAARVQADAPSCQASPGSLDALGDLLREQEREQALRARLAELESTQGARRLACPLPPAPTPVQLPAPPQQQQAALPQERWQNRDVGVFEGCWNLRSDASMRWSATGQVEKIVSWRICFDRSGQGSQTITLDSGRRCEQPTRVAFDPDGTARITEVGRCTYSANASKFRAEHMCKRVSDREASCETREVEGQARGTTFGPYRFER